MTGRLEGKVALITGAARGQGAVEARMFVAEGAQVMLSDVRHDEGEDIAANLDNARYCPLDVTDEDAWSVAVARTLSEFGKIDVLVNNAGILRRGPIETFSGNDFMAVVRINQLSVFLGMQAVISAMRSRGGSIVNISSGAGLVGSPNLVAYTATKWAVRGMTKSAALELAPFGIRVNSVHPGLIDTDMFRTGVGPERGSMLTDLVPLARVGTAEEAANVVLFLASDESAYCTGSEFAVDGGNTLGRRYSP